MAAPLSTEEIARELVPFGVELPGPALNQLSLYLELLLRWNRRVNLTGLREPRAIVRRLFGESLYISRVVKLRGWLVDVGSGAGFPGLALKLAAPDLRVTLVETRQRKCALLKEVARQCGFYNVDVVVERFEAWSGRVKDSERADFITTRAVEIGAGLLQCAGRMLVPDGRLVLSTTAGLAQTVREQEHRWTWHRQVTIPNSTNSCLLIGSVQ